MTEDLLEHTLETAKPKGDFGAWWDREDVQTRFGHVPVDVARTWLFKGWKASPYRWLNAAHFTFSHLHWPLTRLMEIRTAWNSYAEGKIDCTQAGHDLVSYQLGKPGQSIARYMSRHQAPPAPLVILDNRDGNLSAYPEAVEADIPKGMILIAGHKRFNIALSLEFRRKLERLPVWQMNRIRP